MKPKTLRGTQITVKAVDIKRGARYLSNSCPVARAINRTLGNNIACVAGDVVCLDRGIYIDTYRLPLKVDKFVVAFDKGTEVAPFTFRLGARTDLEVR